ncbi:DUF1642 domain-containing protein [Streptococcus oralis]|uniref:DUF1642 domain-containing protein n=1 Tax=Streptococcus oralis TaxID=1303 RepID=UPI0019D219AC|nr:DUF1642 domain-containing protein [Streptococcus oralis]MBN6014319.1 DUF1642 domain-containing protein [Streptococcus oralis subsp. oralis]
MKKQELIKHIEDLPYKEGPIVDKIDISRKGLLELVKQLDESETVTIPQFVAGWIKYCKLTGVNLYHALEMGDLYFCNYANQKDYSKLKEFFEVKGNQELFARAWLDGYTVEEEKKYKITLLNRNDGDLYLVNQNAGLADKYGHFSPVVLLFTKCTNFSKKCYELTKKEVVSYDFGWVFDCPGIKIEEVKDE